MQFMEIPFNVVQICFKVSKAPPGPVVVPLFHTLLAAVRNLASVFIGTPHHVQ